ncbi:MAG: ABC transporter permease [Ruminococcus flavefaciens]|nr:ABC transporter permease [Ruminococcus flavefaciens]
MTIIFTEMSKWKRNKTVWGIFIFTALLGLYAVERAYHIPRDNPLMDSFGDLYTLAFKNLTSLFLPIVLGMFATTLFFDELKNDTLKGLLIIPVSKSRLYFSKIAVVIFMSLGLCLFMFVVCVIGGWFAGGFIDLNTETILQAGRLFLAGGILTPLAMLPIIFLATLSKGYILPIGITLLYLVPVVIVPSPLIGIHPLVSAMVIYAGFSDTAAKMVRGWMRVTAITVSPLTCFISILVIGSVSAVISVIALRKQNY